MTVLSDWEIEKLCVKPTAVLFIDGNPVDTVAGDDIAIQKYKLQQEGFYRSTDASVSVVKLENIVFGETPAERRLKEFLDTFKPMIDPFYNQQIKERHELSAVPFPYDPDAKPEQDPNASEIEKMMQPWSSYRRTTKLISYGLSSYGYDLRLAPKVKVFTNVNTSVVDPKNFDEMSFVEIDASEKGYVIIPPNSFVLGYSLERLTMPTDVVGVVLGKSTIARCGIGCLATPLEPAWEGHVTLEFHNSTPLPAKLYVNEGCCQVMFFQGEEPRVTYAMRSGKYNNQPADAVPPRC